MNDFSIQSNFFAMACIFKHCDRKTRDNLIKITKTWLALQEYIIEKMHCKKTLLTLNKKYGIEKLSIRDCNSITAIRYFIDAYLDTISRMPKTSPEEVYQLKVVFEKINRKDIIKVYNKIHFKSDLKKDIKITIPKLQDKTWHATSTKYVDKNGHLKVIERAKSRMAVELPRTTTQDADSNDIDSNWEITTRGNYEEVMTPLISKYNSNTSLNTSNLNHSHYSLDRNGVVTETTTKTFKNDFEDLNNPEDSMNVIALSTEYDNPLDRFNFLMEKLGKIADLFCYQVLYDTIDQIKDLTEFNNAINRLLGKLRNYSYPNYSWIRQLEAKLKPLASKTSTTPTVNTQTQIKEDLSVSVIQSYNGTQQHEADLKLLFEKVVKEKNVHFMVELIKNNSVKTQKDKILFFLGEILIRNKATYNNSFYDDLQHIMNHISDFNLSAQLSLQLASL